MSSALGSRSGWISWPRFWLSVFIFAALAWRAGAQTNIQIISSFNLTNGAFPVAALTLGKDGDFYGVTQEGGVTNSDYPRGMGTVFQVTSNGVLTMLAAFDFTNGAYPEASLTQGLDGNFYGTTMIGGKVSSQFPSGAGTIFQVTTNGTLNTLVAFSGENGAIPKGALALTKDGSFYGTTDDGGNGYGSVFRVTASGVLTTLGSFSLDLGAGANGLTFGGGGNFYGSCASAGGASGSYGSIFHGNTDGTLIKLTAFTAASGATPEAALTLGPDGSFYGTTAHGMSGTYGTVFRVTTNGDLTTLVSFYGTNGSLPEAALTLGPDGNFYGTTAEGVGSGSAGTVFQVTTNGVLTTLAFFSPSNQAFPEAGLTLGNDGNFYGMTELGGISNATFKTGLGTIYRLWTIPFITLQPQSQTNYAGTNATFTCEAILGPTGFQWQLNGTNLTNGGSISGATSNTLTITGLADGDAGDYSVLVSNAQGTVSSAKATLTVIDPPSITAQPTNVLVLAGTNVTFGVTLAGTTPFSYQWLSNSAVVAGATNTNYTIPFVNTNAAGNYSLIVSNLAGSVTSSNAALGVVVSPDSQTDYASASAAFNVIAISPGVLSYQWQKNGQDLLNGGNISGATNATLSMADLSDADAAAYDVVVTSAYDSVTSSIANLTVNDSLWMATQPLSQTIGASSSVTFTAVAYGAAPFVFQWTFNGNPVGPPTSGTNYSSITLTNVGTNQAGSYAVEVFNRTGSLTSSNAILTVIPQPGLSLKVLAGYPALTLSGTLGSRFLVQYNTNLANMAWVTLLCITNLSASPYQFLDPSGLGQSERFYRAFFSQ
jgi:uncharacterized repeat protein (TIGR03803 family)